MLPIRRRRPNLKTAPFLTTDRYIMSTFLLKTAQAGLETNGVSRGTAAAPADAKLPSPEAYIRDAGHPGHPLKPASSRPAHILKAYELKRTEHSSHFLCLGAQNTQLTHKLFSPKGLGSDWQLLPKGTEVGCAESLQAEQQRLSFSSVPVL